MNSSLAGRLAIAASLPCVLTNALAATLTGRVVDAADGSPIACRLYVESDAGKSYFARSASPEGSAVVYDRARSPQSAERHTSLSAHPFTLELPDGNYRITAVHGKEFREASRQFTVAGADQEVVLQLSRWSNVAADGWYSGDTHVHRTVEELPNAMLAEDLNVAFPLTYWVTTGLQPPAHGDKNSPDTYGTNLIQVDATHVIYPRNTEYEIFRVGSQGHTLGAVFILNHKQVFEIGVPPVKPVAKLAREQGALLELDKHNWPWSMALVPLMGVDLFELSNNHIWRTEFYFKNFGEPAPAYMGLGYDGKNGTERDWMYFGFANYYALLNCGFDMKPTAGTASGVHPVPLGFGRVYVRVDGDFTYDKWVAGLAAGRSFVTTGPMMKLTLNGRDPGWKAMSSGKEAMANIEGVIESAFPLSGIEIIRNGEVLKRLEPENARSPSGAYATTVAEQFASDESAWYAVRCFEDRPDQRMRFAHSGIWRLSLEGRPVRPRREETDYLIQRVEAELARSPGVLPETAIAEYEEALRIYRDIAKRAK